MSKEKGSEGVNPTPESEDMASQMMAGLKSNVVEKKEQEKPAPEPESVVISVKTDAPFENDEVVNKAAELIKLANLLGIDLSGGKKVVFEDDETDIDEPAEVPECARKFKIIIHEQDNFDENRDVFVGLNGYGYLIKRGKEVVVPEGVVNVLKESIITTIKKNPDTGEDEVRNIPRFSFSNYGEVIEGN
jgi:hypothetical protein